MTTIFSYSSIATAALIKNHYDIPPGGLSGLTKNQKVGAREEIATIDFPSEFALIDLSDILGVPADEVNDYLQVLVNDPFEVGDVVAKKRQWPNTITVKSPIDGRVTRIENGVALIEGETEMRSVQARAPGQVVDVEPRAFVVTETIGARIEGAWAHGKSSWGVLKTIDEAPSLETLPDRLGLDSSGAIIAIGSPLTPAFLKEAHTFSIRAVIASSLSPEVIPVLEDYPGLPVFITQGFGEMPMSARILNLLNTYNGREIALNSDVPTNWRKRRPEIIIPLSSQKPEREETPATTYRRSDKVRVLQSPFFGEIGTITRILPEAQQLESGLWMYGAMVEMPSNETLFVAFNNMARLD